MANSGITWGKPLVEYGLTGEEDAAPSSFKAMPTAEENTVLLTTVKGSANEKKGKAGTGMAGPRQFHTISYLYMPPY